MKKAFLFLFLMIMSIRISAQEIIHTGSLTQSVENNDLIVGTTLVKANKTVRVYYNKDSKTCSYKEIPSDYIDGYIIPSNVKKIAKGCFADSKINHIFIREGQDLEFADGAFDGYTGVFYVGWNVIDSQGPSNVRSVEMDDSGNKVEEVGRYNISGVKVQESTDGQVQIILYSNGSAKKVTK